MPEGNQEPEIGEWQRRLLLAMQPVGLALLTLWLFWLLIAVVDNHIDGLLGWLAAVLGVVTSIALIFAGAGYRKALRERG
jgi:hypothetical protein